MANASFDLERLEAGDDAIVVKGRWSGVRGMRFVRPTLTIGSRRLLATLEHKPWAPEARRPVGGGVPVVRRRRRSRRLLAGRRSRGARAARARGGARAGGRRARSSGCASSGVRAKSTSCAELRRLTASATARSSARRGDPRPRGGDAHARADGVPAREATRLQSVRRRLRLRRSAPATTPARSATTSSARTARWRTSCGRCGPRRRSSHRGRRSPRPPPRSHRAPRRRHPTTTPALPDGSATRCRGDPRRPRRGRARPRE